MKRLLFFLLLSVSLYAHGEITYNFDTSFNRPTEEKLFASKLAYFYNPSLVDKNNALHRFQDGRTVYFCKGLRVNEYEYDRKWNISRGYPNLWYVCLDYPEEGMFYGIVMTGSNKSIKDHYLILSGIMIQNNGEIIETAGRTPKEWKKEGVTKPAGKYEYFSNNRYFFSDPIESDVIMTLSFSPGGILQQTYEKKYTKYAHQELAGESTYKTKQGKYKTNTQLTGGWYFDIHGIKKYNGKWNMGKDGILHLPNNGKCTISTTTNLNTERIIEDWKDEAALRFMEFKMEPYNRQYLAQCRADYPNHTVRKEKENLTSFLKENAIISPDVSYKVIGIGKNDLIIRAPGNEKWPIYFDFQKKIDWSTKLHTEDLRTAYNLYENSKYMPSTDLLNMKPVIDRNERIANQIINSTIPELKGLADVYFGRMNDDETEASMMFIVKNEDGIHAKQGTFRLNGSEVDLSEFGTTVHELTALPDAIKTFENNKLKLSEALKRKDKKAKKLAKNYFKQYPDHNVDTTFYTLDGYTKAVERVRKAIECQPIL